MKGILVLAHGSRATETEETLAVVAGMTRELLPDALIETAFMEFGKVNIAAGLDKLVAGGADTVAVIPYFLFEGIHIREDIPEELDQYRQAHPQLEITMGRTLGADKRLADILRDRIEEVL